jgi:ERF superfamily
MSELTTYPAVANPPHVLTAINEVKIALAIEGVGKSRENTEQRFKFRGIDDILNALAVPMAKAGLVVFPHVEERIESLRERDNGKFTTRVALNVVFNFVSAKDGSGYACRIQSEANDYSDKATNKAISFAMKYAYIAVFNIPVVGAEDGDFESPGNETSAAPAAAASAPAAEKPAAKGRAKKAAPVEQTAENNALIKLLSGLDTTVADKLASVMQKAYGVKSVVDVPVDKVEEATTRAQQWLTATAAAAAKQKPASQPVSSSDIPE